LGAKKAVSGKPTFVSFFGADDQRLFEQQRAASHENFHIEAAIQFTWSAVFL
jgi:hypothetical protein